MRSLGVAAAATVACCAATAQAFAFVPTGPSSLSRLVYTHGVRMDGQLEWACIGD